MKMKNMSPVFLLPPLMFMGMMPFMLATLKGIVVKAMMLNQVAFMSTLWMTVRDVVFGPRPIVKYYNYGYKPAPRPPVHYRHPAPPAPHVDHHVEHHHSEPVHFEHHHEEHHLPDHRVEHHVEHHETHGASPFFHDESSSGEDYAQDLSYVGANDRNDRDDRRGVKQQQQQDGLLDEDEEAGAMLPQASAYRRPGPALAPARPRPQHYEAQARPNRLRYAGSGTAVA
ncbi:Phosphatidylinositol-3-phosphatase [Frankliniella fusca]|uniref:Phosphatidylinositol-3-phosphatase n=1 Tax=Frankliniella fusca TaxID=407009 RepID=A0AAE1HKR2_9NEOP|nr:Phosphatidylinositol-3-phosphatase [Frankliniella fusca]